MGIDGFLLVGKVVGVHGLKGNIKVYSYAESLSVFEPGGPILAVNKKGLETTYIINWVKPHHRVALLSLEGIAGREFAETLVGSKLYIEKAKLPKLEDGSYYWFDLIGLSVFTTANEYLGNIEAIIPTGSNDVYVVKHPDKDHDNEILIPALASVVLEIDVNQKTMRVDLPEGL
ncbi:MAG: 16S rRNA processing protein RimM [Desulfobacterales bacterium]|uniref:Ribosome maturation factor RimM n=1 Tax=Candidatus Desulfatibia profunda TaxID=2841695 RepID=A0A8J6NP48_9BACT|nr:16S rRNA processing protein RimM [Candidatus Desulfatibia profunda]MBL7180869.1 16S rRNA processing protein RimM [Desulfobacterales bacterium]